MEIQKYQMLQTDILHCQNATNSHFAWLVKEIKLRSMHHIWECHYNANKPKEEKKHNIDVSMGLLSTHLSPL